MQQLFRTVTIITLLALTMSFVPKHALAQDVTCESDVVVQADDWLSKIADKAFGDVLTYPAIAEATNTMAANDESYATIEDVNVIEPGWKLCIPGAEYAQSILGIGLEAAPESADSVQIPTVEEGKMNVAFIYVGPIGDGGWSYAHNEGRRYLDRTFGDQINTAYLESIPEGADSERVIRNLARQGFDIIFTTSYGFMDPTAVVAEEFPDTVFLHVSGQKKNDTNFGNVFGAMEEMKYLSGMIAGAKAAEDGSNRVGIIAPFPTAEVIRLSNAAAMGMRHTCPDCIMDIRWIFTWFDPVKEREAAESLLDAGSTVVITGADTGGPVQAAGERDATGIAYDSENGCLGMEAYCLTVPYWNWGPVYADIVEGVQDGTWVPENFYGSTADGMVALYGFMEGQEPYSSVPESVIPEVRDLLSQMQAGEYTRFDIFTGPINDNQGNEVIPAGVTLTQSDLEGLTDGFMSAFNITGREPCTICMDFLVEGFDPTAEIPPLN